MGTILSGNKLVDNIEYSKHLAKKNNKAIGGEMEGSGISVICEQEKV